MTLLLAGCEGAGPSNQAPEVILEIPDQEMRPRGETRLDLSAHFTDPEGDTLTFDAKSSDVSVVAASVAMSTLLLKSEVAKGQPVTVEVTASDQDGGTVTEDFKVTIRNAPPRAVGEIPHHRILSRADSTFSLLDYFEDEDGDTLNFSAETSNDEIAEVEVSSEGDMTVSTRLIRNTPATIEVTATDRGDEEASLSFEVLVLNRPPEPTEEMQDRILSPGDTVTVRLTDHFTDPEGDELTFNGRSTEERVVETVLDGPLLLVIGRAAGQSEIQVAVSDPFGGESDGSFEAIVVASSDSWKENFDSAKAIEGWDRRVASGASIRVEDGELKIRMPQDQDDNTFTHVWNADLVDIDEDWTLKASMGEAGQWVAGFVSIHTGNPDLPMWSIDMCYPYAEWYFMAYDGESGRWRTLVEGELDEDVEGLQDVEVSLKNDTLTIIWEGERLYEDDADDWWPTDEADPPPGVVGIGAGAQSCLGLGATARFNWIEVKK